MRFFLVLAFVLATLSGAKAENVPPYTDSTGARLSSEGDVALSSSGSMPTGSGTYTASIKALASYATPTDIVCLIGSATKTVRLTNGTFYVQSSLANPQVLYFVKRTTANTGGTPTAVVSSNQGEADTQSPAPTASVVSYGSAPTLGSGTTASIVFFSSVQVTASPALIQVVSFFNNGNRGNYFNSLVLRGVNESFCWNYNGAALAAGWVLNFNVSWTEE